MIKKFLALFLIVSFGACTSNEQPENKGEPEIKINYIKYYVRYLESGEELQLDAKYHNDSIAIAIADGVFVGEKKLTAKELPREGWMHRFVKRGETADSLIIFRYNVSSSKEVQDTVSLPIYKDFSLETPQVSKKTGGLLVWKGSPLNHSDGLVLIFEDKSGNNFTHTHRGITPTTQFQIRPDMIQTLEEGKITLRVVHKRESRINLKNKQIFRQSEYYRKPIEFELVKK